MTYVRSLHSNIGVGRFLIQHKPTPSKSSGRYHRSNSDFINSFYAVLRRWERDTAFYSDPDKITSHPSFMAMVQNAQLITPLIINELRVRPSLLVWVLDDAFSEKPYTDEIVGDIPRMTNAWLAWAERDGL